MRVFKPAKPALFTPGAIKHKIYKIHLQFHITVYPLIMYLPNIFIGDIYWWCMCKDQVRTWTLPEVLDEMPNNHMTPVRHCRTASSNNCPTPIRHCRTASPNNHPTPVRHPSDTLPKTVRHPSNTHPTYRPMSDILPKTIQHLSDTGPTPI